MLEKHIIFKMDEDEYLRRALEENLRVTEERQRRIEDAQRQAREAEERIIRISESTAQREQEATENEAEELRLAMERSVAEEQARERRLAGERDRLSRMDREFGDRSTVAPNTQSRTAPHSSMPGAFVETASQPGPITSHPAPGRRHTLRESTPALEETRRQPRRQNSTPPSRPPPAAEDTPLQASTISLPSRIAAGRALPRRRSTQTRRTLTPDPNAYFLADILARSRADAFSRGPFRPDDADPVFDAGLQAAINASANQARDEDEEAVQRSRGVPTYQEACRMPRYQAPRGARYVFQGPRGPGASAEGAVKIVGDMDLREAMKVANQNVNRDDERR
ncbi:hypothetical protein LOZ65_001343 [Ophidiomyces ophidiicola]|nr:hypothetical protein LOZ65_001343 [Ophidiomyces ophidiicola]